MPNYLWELDLENIPLGWNEIYQEALQEIPDGEIKIFECDDTVEGYFYHPVRCRGLLVESFNEYKKKALDLLSQKDQIHLREFTSKLVYIDATLFDLLEYWCNDYYDFASMNPDNFIDSNVDMGYYFDSRNTTPAKDFIHLRVLASVQG